MAAQAAPESIITLPFSGAVIHISERPQQAKAPAVAEAEVNKRLWRLLTRTPRWRGPLQQAQNQLRTDEKFGRGGPAALRDAFARQGGVSSTAINNDRMVPEVLRPLLRRLREPEKSTRSSRPGPAQTAQELLPGEVGEVASVLDEEVAPALDTVDPGAASVAAAQASTKAWSGGGGNSSSSEKEELELAKQKLCAALLSLYSSGDELQKKAPPQPKAKVVPASTELSVSGVAAPETAAQLLVQLLEKITGSDMTVSLTLGPQESWCCFRLCARADGIDRGMQAAASWVAGALAPQSGAAGGGRQPRGRGRGRHKRRREGCDAYPSWS
jgi:hypothetical protein